MVKEIVPLQQEGESKFYIWYPNLERIILPFDPLPRHIRYFYSASSSSFFFSLSPLPFEILIF